MKISVHAASASEVESVRRLYCDVGYPGGVADSDRVVVATVAGLVVGAFRLTHEEGVFVLRGMRVTPARQLQGIGTRLLHGLQGVEEPCFLIAHAHLQRFYGRAGFVALADEASPGFLGARAAEYRSRGLDAVVMRRKPAS